MLERSRVAKVSLGTALVGTTLAIMLLAAASLQLWMAGANGNHTPRINAESIGLGIVPLVALTWILYLWTRTWAPGVFSYVVRVVMSCVLLLIFAYCLFAAMFTMFFVG